MKKIYRLIYNDETIYIGITKRELEIRKRAGYKFIDFYRDCSIELIEETEDVSRERYWIQYYKDLGCNLYNKYNGNGLTKEERKELFYNFKERNPDYYKQYFLNHKEQVKESNRKYYDGNKEKIIEKSIEYKKINKDAWNEYQRAYNKKKRLNENNI